MTERERKLETLRPQEVINLVNQELERTGRVVKIFPGIEITLGIDDDPHGHRTGSMIGEGVVVELEDGRRFGLAKGRVVRGPEITPFRWDDSVLIYGFLEEREDGEDKGRFREVLERAWFLSGNGLGEVAGNELFLNGAGVPRDYVAWLEEIVRERPVGLGKWGIPIYPSSSEQAKLLEKVPARAEYSRRVVPYLVGEIKENLGIHQPL